MSASVTVDLVGHFLLDHLLREQVAAQVFAHVGGAEVAALELGQERVLWDVGLRIKVGLVELGVRQFDLQRLALLEQELLDDQLVQEIQLGGQGVFFRRLLARGRRAAIRLLDVITRDLVAVDDGPGVPGWGFGRSGGCAGRVIAARGGQDCQGKDKSDSGHLYIVAAACRITSWTRRDALRQGRRTGLENVGGLHLVDPAVPDRGHVLPSRPRADPFLANRLAAPRADDHIRRPRDDLLAGHDPILRQAGIGQLGEDRLAAGDLDELLGPANAADQRVVPFLEKHFRTARQRLGALANVVEALFERGDERGALLGNADDPGEHANHLQDLGDAALVEGEDRVAALDEVVGDVGLEIGEREDQIRFERLDLFVARVQERRDLRLLTRLRRADGVAGDADDTIAFAEEIERFGGFFGEADDALREH